MRGANKFFTVLPIVFGPLYFVTGLVQLAAVYAWADSMVGWLLGAFLGFFLTYLPIVGNLIAVYAASQIWGWSLPWSFALGFGWLAMIPVLFLLSLIAGDD